MVLRAFVAITGWMAAVFLGVACFLTAGPSQGRGIGPVAQETLAFACSFAIAGATAAILTMFVGGRKSWALEAAASIALVIVLFVSVVCTLLWLIPSVGRGRMNYWHFLALRDDVGAFGRTVATFYAPVGVTLGLVAGGVAGLLTILRLRRPRLAMGLAAVLLVLCASRPIHRVAFSSVTDLMLDWRRASEMRKMSWVRSEEIDSPLGATFGAIVGALIGGLMTRKSRGTRGESPGP